MNESAATKLPWSSRLGWFLASWFPGRMVYLGNSGYRCDWSDLVRRGRFKDGV